MNELVIYLLIRDDLHLTKGKIAAQCCHAVEELIVSCDQRLKKSYLKGDRGKVCLKVKDLQEMEWISQDCKEKRIPYHIVEDAGKTEVKEGTQTILGIGPISKVLAQSLVGHLKLL